MDKVVNFICATPFETLAHKHTHTHQTLITELLTLGIVLCELGKIRHLNNPVRPEVQCQRTYLAGRFATLCNLSE
jgi:hypothetical protein